MTSSVGTPPVRLTSLDFLCGVNDAGDIALSGVNAEAGGSQALVLSSDGTLAPVSFSSASAARVFGGATINDAQPAEVAVRDRISGTWLMRRWSTDLSTPVEIIGRSPDHFDSTSFYCDINDSGVVTGAGLVGGSTATRLYAGTSRPPLELATWTGSVRVRPQISDSNHIVVRDNLERIQVYGYPNGTVESVAPSSWVGTDSEPGISGDGQAVAFTGDRGNGPGLFLGVRDGSGWEVLGVLGEGADAFTSFQTNRVGVTSRGDLAGGQSVTIAFAGTRGSDTGVFGVRALVKRDAGGGLVLQASTSDTTPPGASLVAAVGEEVEDPEGVLQTLASFRLNDPVNALGEIVFWANFASGGSGILKASPPMRRVLWGKELNEEIPATDVSIEVYWVDGNNNVDVIDPVGPGVKANERGLFVLPQEFAEEPLQPGEFRRGIRAVFSYSEPVGDTAMARIVNYPEWDPIGGAIESAGLSAAELKEAAAGIERTIRIPFPVVLQPGVFTNSLDAALGLREFLKADAGVTQSKRARSGISGVPAYPFFAMPSQSFFLFGGDGDPEGYNANAVTTTPSQIDLNAVALHNYITGRVFEILRPWNADTDVPLPIHLMCHSYGGLVSRNWLVLNRAGAFAALAGVQHPERSPVTARSYVSFDGVHGGTRWATTLGWSTFREAFLNGESTGDNEEPDRATPGWNTARRVPLLDTTLLISNSDDRLRPSGVISPFSSALGVGRVRRRFLVGANGYCVSPVRGWQAFADFETHGIQTVPQVYEPAVRFISDGTPPRPGNDFSFVNLDRSPQIASECRVLELRAGADPDPLLVARAPLLQASAGGSEVGPVVPFENGALFVQALVTGTGRSLEVVDGAGIALPKLEPLVDALGEIPVESFRVEPPPGEAVRLRLSAGPVDDAAIWGGSIYRLDRPSLQVSTDGTYVPVGQGPLVTASFLSGGTRLTDFTSAQVQANLVGTNTTSVALLDDGVAPDVTANDGLFTGRFAGTAIPESATVETTADVVSTSEGRLVRADSKLIEIAAQNATVTGYQGLSTTDADGNGLAEELVMTFDVLGSAPGTYRLSAEITSLIGGNLPLNTSLVFDGGLGSQPVELRVPASFVRTASGFPLTLESIQLFNLGGDTSYHTFPDVFIGSIAPMGFEAPPPPTLGFVSPSNGPTSGGNELVLRGEGFTHTRLVKIGNRNAVFEVLSDTTILVTAPGDTRSLEGVPNGTGQPIAGPRSPLATVVVSGPRGSSRLIDAYRYDRP